MTADRRRGAVALVSIEYPPTVGGVAHATRRLARALVDNGYAVHVIVPLFDGSRAPAGAPDDDIEVHWLPVDMSGGLEVAGVRLLSDFKRLDRQFGFVLFHSFFLITAYPCALLAGPSRPVIVNLRGGDAATEHHPAIRRAALYSLANATWITSVNHALLDGAGRLVNIANRCSVIRNGVEPAPADRRWSLRTRTRGDVGMVGQFRRVKDVPLLIRAFARMRASLRHTLHLYGRFIDADEERWSRTLIEEFDLTAQVHLHGEQRRDDLLHVLPSLHVYVQCSADEGLPNALLDAAAYGVPIVATAVGGMREVLSDGENALLVPHGDPSRLAAAIERILSDDALATRLSQGSVKLADRLSARAERQAWLDLYERLLAAST
jgi:glycosyltransferase involved in cell wall biosynthesis